MIMSRAIIRIVLRLERCGRKMIRQMGGDAKFSGSAHGPEKKLFSRIVAWSVCQRIVACSVAVDTDVYSGSEFFSIPDPGAKIQ
jgi:hypothetical protein